MTGPGEFPDEDDTLRHIERIINTLGEEATGGEQDFDRVLPESLRDTIDEETAARIAQDDREGVPLPYALQFASAMTDWINKMQGEGLSPELHAEINIGLASRETRFPDSILWDRARGELAKRMQVAGDVHAALELVYGMRSMHALARTVMEMTGQIEDEADAGIVVQTVFDRFSREDNNVNLIRFLQATYDEMVSDNPDMPAIDIFEGILRRENPNYDPAQSWAESMREVWPGVDWDSMASLIRNEEQWAGMPLRFRQYVIRSHLNTLKVLEGEVTPDLIDRIGDDINRVEGSTHQALIWDQFRYSYGAHLAENGFPEFALEFGRAMHKADYQAFLASELIQNGAEDHAMQLTNMMTDAKLMAQMLFEGGWSDDRGSERLAAIIADETYPLGRRIDCLIFLRDRMQETGNAEAAARFNNQLMELRRRLAEE